METIMSDETANITSHNRRGRQVSSQVNKSYYENACYKKNLKIFDIFISSVIIGPTVVAYWRGSFGILNRYFIPGNLTISAVISVGIGVLATIILLVFQKCLNERFHPETNRLTFYFTSRLYTYAFGIANVNAWRGTWTLLDILTGLNVYVVITTILVSIVLLTAMKTLRNLSAPPFAIVNDKRTDYFLVKTFFKSLGNHNPGLYVLDCIFSVLVVGTLVIVVWRGAWIFLDIILFPENFVYSSWISLAIGYGIVAITFALQPLMRWTCDRLTGFSRLAVADAFLLLSFTGTINVWRGVWNLIDIYFLPENPLLSYSLTHGLSFILLALLNCSNSVLVRGVYVDAEEPAGQCVVFPIHYIRLFFQKERSKKQKRLLEALERQDQNHMFLLDKSQLNNIKIVKSNGGIVGGPEMKPMLNLENEKS